MLRLFSFPAVYTFVKMKYGDEPQFFGFYSAMLCKPRRNFDIDNHFCLAVILEC